jgi:serine/threonine protein kinase, bacterial
MSDPDAVTGYPDDPSAEGEVFGPYRLLELLGRGGMGEVWRAYDTRRERTVAVKRLSGGWADVPEFRKRFRLEARATAQLSSEHVIVIHDYGEIDRRLFIDMRLAAGGDLGDLIGDHPDGLPPAQATDLCTQIADGLEAAHHARLIHRDVKPSNVLLAPDSGGHRAYLVDFGIAKVADELTSTGLTASGHALGTPAYMAPELIDGSRPAGPASDIYALGCVLFEMLTGRRVFRATTTAALMHQHLTQTPPAPSSVRPGLAPFDGVLARALAKDPDERQADAASLAREAAAAGAQRPLGRAARDDDPTIDPPLLVAPARRWRGRRTLLAVLAVVVLIGGVTAAVVATLPSTTAQPATPARPAVVGPVVPGTPQQLAISTQGPNGLAFSADGAYAYVTDGAANTLLVENTATGATVASVPVGPDPTAVALSPDGARAYVTNTGTDQAPAQSVSVVDTATNTAVATVTVGTGPIGAVVTPDSRFVYVSDNGTFPNPARSVSVIDAETNTVAATIPVADGPSRPAISPYGSYVYVPGFGGQGEAASTLSIINTASNTATTVPAGDTSPSAVIASRDGRRVYIVCQGATGTPGSVQVLDTATRTLSALGVGPVDSPLAGALSPDGRTLVVPNWGLDQSPGNSVSVIDTTTGAVHKVTLPGRPYEAAVTPDGTAAWVTTADPGGVWRIPLTPS